MAYGSGFQVMGRKINDFTKDWLYGDYDKQKIDMFTALYSVPGVRQYFDYLLDLRADQEYLSRYGMDYTDVHDPRKLKQTSSGAAFVGSAYHMVSRNIDSLYSDYKDSKKKTR